MSDPDRPPARLTSGEFLTAFVHLYRGEQHRALVWRSRLDTTGNWAVGAVAGILSFAFGSREASHWVILLGQVVVLSMLWIEARRYRYYSVWHWRVRLMEEGFYLPLLRDDPGALQPDGRWRTLLADDLARPTFKIGLWQAVGLRLRQTYLWMVTLLMVAWGAKLMLHPVWAPSLDSLIGRVATHGGIGWNWTVVVIVTLGYLTLVGLALTAARPEEASSLGEPLHRTSLYPRFRSNPTP